MTPVRAIRMVAALLAMFVTHTGLAQGPAAPAGEASAEGIPYLTGGVGKEEREQIETSAKDYNLKLVFAESSGAFVADVQVAVKSSDGSTVLAATAKGPLFFAKLPAGSYRVEATYRGDMKESSTSVAATGQRVLDFRW